PPTGRRLQSRPRRWGRAWPRSTRIRRRLPGPEVAITSADDKGSVDYLLLGHVTVDRLDEKRVGLGGTATYAALTARNMGARAGIHTSASYEPGLIETLRGVLVAR